MKFVIEGGGDSDVGIPSTDATVTFDDNSVWDKDLIEHTKALLKEWDDNGANIWTEDEYDEMIKSQNNHDKEMLLTRLHQDIKEGLSCDDFITAYKDVLL